MAPAIHVEARASGKAFPGWSLGTRGGRIPRSQDLAPPSSLPISSYTLLAPRLRPGSVYRMAPAIHVEARASGKAFPGWSLGTRRGRIPRSQDTATHSSLPISSYTLLAPRLRPGNLYPMAPAMHVEARASG